VLRVGVVALLGRATASPVAAVARVPRPLLLLVPGGALAPTSPLGRLRPPLLSVLAVDPQLMAWRLSLQRAFRLR
jgi:hypothetical protein